MPEISLIFFEYKIYHHCWLTEPTVVSMVVIARAGEGRNLKNKNAWHSLATLRLSTSSFAGSGCTSRPD
jgi:hypothetical protein